MIAARIRLYDRDWYLRDLPRVVQQVNYVARAMRAGMNNRHVGKVKHYFDPWPYYMRQEMRALLLDMQRR